MNSMINDLNAIRLNQAVLCAGCEVISNSPNDACLVCGSRSLLPLARVLAGAGQAEQPTEPNQSEDEAHLLIVVPSISHRSRQRGHPRG